MIRIKDNKKKKKSMKVLRYIIIMLIGFIGGLIGVSLSLTDNIEVSNIFGDTLLFLISFLVAFLIQVILHELGHLICGLLSGYELVSFRVGSLTLVKENDKFLMKKFNVKGTGGQCLMMPKEDNYEKISYVLYNLGGLLMNGLVVILCSIAIKTLHLNRYIHELFLSLIIVGVMIFITNGIPMKIGGVANDGYNVISIMKNKLMKYCFYTQLRVNGLLHKGMRYKDMPLDWFNIDENSDFSNPLVCSIKIMEANYYHDNFDFEKAKEYFEFLLNYRPKIISLYENEIKCELLFYEIIGEGNIEKINDLYTKELKNYIKITDCYINRKRLMYAYYLIIEKDMKKVEQILKEMEKVKKTYPIKAEVESEIELIEFINEKFER